MGTYVDRSDTLPDSANKADFYNLVDNARPIAVADDDEDTKIQVEEGADDDTIRFDCAGTEQVTIQDGKIEPTTDNDVDLGASSKEFKDLYIDGTANIDVLSLVSDVTTATAFDINVNSLTTGKAICLDNADAITTGSLLYLETNSSDTSARNLVYIANENTAADAAIPLSIKNDGDGGCITLDNNANGDTIIMDVDGNSSNDLVGIDMDIANAGSGDAAAFDFKGDLHSASQGGTGDGKIKVLVGGNARYMYVYTD